MHLRELDANLIVILDALLLEASVTKAAERLGRSPSAVSHALARLREIFGDPLFVRAGQRLVPTSHATQIAPTVHIIVSGLEGLLHRQHQFDPAQQQREFRIACPDNLELTMVSALRAELAETAQGIMLTRRTGLGCGVVEALRTGKIDLALVEGTPSLEATDISAEKILDDSLVVLAPRDHELAGAALKQTQLRTKGLALIADELHAACAFGEEMEERPPGLLSVSSPLIAIHTALERGALVLTTGSISAIAARHMGLKRVTTSLTLPPVPAHLLWHVSQERDECHTWLRDRLRARAGGGTQSDAPERGAPEPAME